MSPTISRYRDDGPLAWLVRRVPPIATRSETTTGLGLVGLFAGLLSADGVAEPAAIAGIAIFVLLGSAPTGSSSRLSFLVPSLLRLGEYATVVWLGWRDQAEPGLLFALLVVVAFHHYEVVYRLRSTGEPPPTWLDTVTLGWEGRTVVVTAAAAGTILSPTLVVLTSWCALWFFGEAARYWQHQRRNSATAGSDHERA